MIESNPQIPAEGSTVDTPAQLKAILQQMDPYEFEHFVGDLWERMGWETTVSTTSADKGVDITARKSRPYEQLLLIQAKRYGPNTTVGSPDVQQYASLRQQFENNYEGWTITVDGKVENELGFSNGEIRELAKQEHVTRHDCIQGWTYYAKWGGVPISEFIERCNPDDDVKWVVFWTLDEKWEYSEDGPFEEVDDVVPEFYYEAIRLEKAKEPRSILAYEMNNGDLPVAHGAPYRLRIESQLGYKMAKWVNHIEFVEDFEDIGKGKGGWRDDVLNYYPNSADI